MPNAPFVPLAQAGPGTTGTTAYISALAAVLHYLGTFSQAVSLQRRDLRPIAVAASGLFQVDNVSGPDAGPGPSLAAPASSHPASAGPNSAALPAVDPLQGCHQLVRHALTSVAPKSGGTPALRPLLPAGDAASHLAACVELLDSLLALQSALGGGELAAALPRAVSAAVDPQVRLRTV